MRHIVYYMHSHILRLSPEYPAEPLPYPVDYHLSVWECCICGAFHCFKVILSLRRVKWGTRKFPIPDSNPVLPHGSIKNAKVIRCDLVPKAPGATVHHNNDLVLEYSECFGRGLIEYRTWRDYLYLKIMVP